MSNFEDRLRVSQTEAGLAELKAQVNADDSSRRSKKDINPYVRDDNKRYLGELDEGQRKKIRELMENEDKLKDLKKQREALSDELDGLSENREYTTHWYYSKAKKQIKTDELAHRRAELEQEIRRLDDFIGVTERKIKYLSSEINRTDAEAETLRDFLRPSVR